MDKLEKIGGFLRTLHYITGVWYYFTKTKRKKIFGVAAQGETTRKIIKRKTIRKTLKITIAEMSSAYVCAF